MMLPGGEPFESLLREKMAELEADESTPPSAADPLEGFRLAIRHAVLGEHGNPLPRPGHQAYVTTGQAVTEPDTRTLDVRS